MRCRGVLYTCAAAVHFLFVGEAYCIQNSVSFAMSTSRYHSEMYPAYALPYIAVHFFCVRGAFCSPLLFLLSFSVPLARQLPRLCVVS